MEPTHGGLERGMKMLRRLWFIPVGLFLVGLLLGPSTVSDKVGVETTMRLSEHPGVTFLTFNSFTDKQAQANFALQGQPLATQLEQEFNNTKGATVDVSSNVNGDEIVATVSGHDSSKVADEADAIVARARDLRKSAAVLIADSTNKAVTTARQSILDYLATPNAPTSGGGTVVIVDRTDAVKQLAELDLLSGTADQLRSFDGGVAASTRVISPSRTTSRLILGAVLMLVGAVLVFLIGPYGTRLRDMDDLEMVAGSTPVVALTGSDQEVANSVIAVARHRLPSGQSAVLAPVAMSEPSQVAQRVLAHLQESNDSTVIVARSFPGDMASISRDVGGVLLLVRMGVDRKTDLAYALSNARAMGVPVLALITTPRQWFIWSISRRTAT
jgi:hypothetical protein